ncbi:glycoside hydrolase family 3 protein [Serendipita vermifera MAFF 305830]|uniref:beta-glucosidase n=1 Tax=Serendipita vermifera MAFF 305830 TaxID=933852 RepID=A0A0C3BHI6_SERVB|nr:glycoside hydrolase family 3 protein [Serendipita vermifera MAFF 305830]
MPPTASTFANANLDEIVEALSVDEAIALTGGQGFWHTSAIPRLGVPAIKVSDGPNGIRGNHFFRSTPAKAIPSATALGSTFDPELIGKVASKLLASEAKLRAASIVLAPTVNIQRSPLGGRSFESFSEDPHLSGTIAAAYISGLQSEGVGACIKHFVANDQEDDRQGLDSVLSPRALREIYLMPFMLAQKYANPWAYMTSYGKVNGLHVSESKFLLQGVVRNEWKSNATIMSDWWGCYEVAGPIMAGLDLEMPGTRGFRSQYQMNWSIQARKITVKAVKDRARKVLDLVQKASKGCPESIDGDGIERTNDSEEDKAVMRELAGKTIVLLKNEGQVLPLQAESLKKVAIIGGNAKATVLSGGGSAALKPSFFINPFDGIAGALTSSTEILYAEGARTVKGLPTLEYEIVNAQGGKGFDAWWHSHGPDDKPVQDPIETFQIDETNMFLSDASPKGITERWTMKLKGSMRPRSEDTLFEFGVMVAGRAKLYVDGQLVVDNWTLQRRGNSFFNTGTEEERGQFLLKKGVAHEIYLEFCNVRGPAKGDIDEIILTGGPGLKLGGAPVVDETEEIEKAVAIAKEAEVAIIVVGLNGDWETEGYDRTHLKLPGKTDELIKKVGQVNQRTIVVVQAGSAVEMPWVDDVPTIAHSWYLGNSTGDAIADVLFGKVNPSAKLSMTFPKRLEDTPSYGHFGSENGTVWYAEDLFVGYKHYTRSKVPTLFSFGHGLSYTTFTFSDLKVTNPSGPDLSFVATVKVKNTGAIKGSEVVQIYATPCLTSQLTHPVRRLAGYKKAHDISPGQCVGVEVNLDKYALSYWCISENRWKIEKGVYDIVVGAGADDVKLTAQVEVSKEVYWDGL